MSKKRMENKLLKENQLNFQSYGVKIGIKAENPVFLEKVQYELKKVFPNGFEKMISGAVEHQFFIKSKNDGTSRFYRNEEIVFEGVPDNSFYEAVESQIRITIAEFAVEKVFIHAGVVGWKNRAIIIPAQSWSGKSTLVAELIKLGALYYSDEYAVLDCQGNVEPFPKWLSLRGISRNSAQRDFSVESLGGTAGTKTIPVGMVLIARYDTAKRIPRKWQPKRLTGGEAMMEILRHTLPIRNNPKFVLKVLNKLVTRAIIVKTVRGEAKEFAEMLLNYFEYQTE